MKKLIALLLIISLASFTDAPKPLTVKMPVSDWAVYLRNVERLNAFAGRNVPSEILLTTKDTVSYYQQYFFSQLNEQVKDTTIKKNK